jgi:putative hydrolase of the HAD superfamily
MSHPPLRAVLFDFDGLIVDTESQGYRTWQEIYAAEGHDLPVMRYAQVVGSGFNDVFDPRRELEQLTGKTFAWEEMEAARRAREEGFRHALQPLPGVLERLEEARRLGLRTAIASSSPRSWIDSWLDQLNLRWAFDHVSTVDDTGRVKPDPSLFLHAAASLGVAPAEALIFEDSLNGLRAAQAAGIRCVIVPGPMTAHLDFSGAHRLVSGLHEVQLAEWCRVETLTLPTAA